MNYILFIIIQLIVFAGITFGIYQSKYEKDISMPTVIIWAIMLVLSGTLIFSAFQVERYSWQVQNTTISGEIVGQHYESVIETDEWRQMSFLNIGFFGLSLLFGVACIFEYIKNLKGENMQPENIAPKGVPNPKIPGEK